ncbi:hypothetical protein TL16_g12567, partial [Triparma laevis f. inornata]|uniref:Uncharacterized protein n=2 Tax=Triparma laevis TaxID=1534972 RepID=A0A9W7CE84_9STRA
MGDDIDDEYFDFSNSGEGEIKPDLVDSEGLSAPSGFQINDGDATLDVADNDAVLGGGGGKRKGGADGDGQDDQKKKKKKKKKEKPRSQQSDKQLLITTGRTITSEALPAHAAFFNAAYLPALASAGIPDVSPLTIEKFVSTPIQATTPIPQLDSKLIDFLKLHLFPQHKGGNKRLKHWRSSSPLCVIVSSSAKRSCEVLKTLSGMKTRVGKLFSKNMKKEDQISMLNSNNYAFAVGTPNRLLQLAEDGALSFSKTELIVVDCHADQKGFNVVTLRDTQTDLCKLVKEFVVDVEDCKLSLY